MHSAQQALRNWHSRYNLVGTVLYTIYTIGRGILYLLREWHCRAGLITTHQHSLTDPPARKPTLLRRTACYLLHLPLLLAASLPSIGFVLASNVPKNGWWFDLLGNSVFIAVINLLFTLLIVPKTAFWLAHFRYGVPRDGSLALQDAAIGVNHYYYDYLIVNVAFHRAEFGTASVQMK